MDYLDITLDDGNVSRMEVVTTFKLEKYKYNYIIYCEIDRSHYYIARYGDNGELDTDLDDDELRLCKAVFKGVVG